MEAVANAAVPDIAANADPHSAEQLGIHDETRREIAAVFALQVLDDLLAGIGRELRCRFDRGRALLYFEAEQTFVGFEGRGIMARLLFDQRFEKGRHPAAIEPSVHEAAAKEFLRKL